jgi:hypothetical protein
MRLVEILENRKQALRVSEVTTLFAVTSQHICKMTSKEMVPSLRIAGAIRFDPQDLVMNWLKAQRMNRSTGVRRVCVGLLLLKSVLRRGTFRKRLRLMEDIKALLLHNRLAF